MKAIPATRIVSIKVRPYGGTYIASGAGKRASSTAGENFAALALSKKFKGSSLRYAHDHYVLEIPEEP